MNWIERVIKIFYSPKEVFSWLSQKPDWAIPIIILIIVSLISVSLLYSPIIKPEQLKRIEDSSRLTPEQIEEAKLRFEGNLPLVLALVSTGVVSPIAILIISGILYGMFSLMGGEGKFRQVFAVCSYSNLVAVLGVALKTPLQLAKGSSHVYTSLALVVPGLSTDSALFRLLNSFDIFALWQLWLLILGLGIVYNLSIKKSSIAIIALWVTWIAIKVGLGTLSRG